MMELIVGTLLFIVVILSVMMICGGWFYIYVCFESEFTFVFETNIDMK